MYLIVGAGLSGAVIAQQLASRGYKVLIVDKRDHIGGNCYDYLENDILVSKYGAHLFHTNNEKVWEYINKFSTWERWEHNVLSHVDGKYVPMPVNLTTINMLNNIHLTTIEDYNNWAETLPKYDHIENSEQMAKSRVGDVLYEKLIKPYTMKQWNKDPSELDRSVLERLPLRTDFRTGYFNDKYQALPSHGYTKFISNILDHENIEVVLNTSYIDIIDRKFEGIYYTGSIDSFPEFNKYISEKLEYRSLKFENKFIENMEYFQPNSVVNYPDSNIPYTRIIEHKHFLNQSSRNTIITYEYPKESETDEDKYYPVPNKRNLDLYERYKKLADSYEDGGVYFVGRLANYKYFNMDQAILNALEINYPPYLNC